MPSPFAVRAPRPRFDWREIRDQVSIETVAVALLGEPPGRRGSSGIWYVCPLHGDKNPSLNVDIIWDRWRCFGCSEHGDAAALVMRLEGLSFPEAVRRVAEICGLSPSSGDFPPPSRPKPAASPRKPKAGPSGLPAVDASALVEEAAKAIWTPEGAKALSYLHDRGLTDETIRSARLGWIRRATVPKKDGGSFGVSGICVPWSHRGRLAMVKVRLLPSWRRDGKEVKYISAFGDSPIAFPSLDGIKPGRPLVACEGEFDALLLHQEIGDIASVITLGSASDRRGADVLLPLLRCRPWFAAHDVDANGTGDRAASWWIDRGAERVKPPGGAKDWTAAHQAGCDLRAFWLGALKPTVDHQVEDQVEDHHQVEDQVEDHQVDRHVDHEVEDRHQAEDRREVEDHQVEDHRAATFDPSFGPLDDWDRAVSAILDREGFRLVVRDDWPRDVQTAAKATTTPTARKPAPRREPAPWPPARIDGEDDRTYWARVFPDPRKAIFIEGDRPF